MDTTIQNVIVDLKIVSMVEPNGKLYLYNGVLALEPLSFWVSFKRYMLNSNRHTISQRIKQRLLELETLFAQNHIKDGWIREEIIKIVEPVKNGLSNLKETYANDSQMCVNFDLMIARLNNIASTYLLPSLYDSKSRKEKN